MRKGFMLGIVLVSAALAAPAEAQLGGRVSAEPYIAYGFFGDLPDTNVELDGSVAYGGRVGFQMRPQWGFFGNFQRSNPDIGGGNGDLTVDHWSAGVEFSYIPRGGAEGMLPILFEAGLGQARYEGRGGDFAVNLGLASALQLTPRLAIRYGVNDYISNYNGDGIVNQVFARVGAEIGF